MANLTQIELPNGTTYNLEDTDGRKEENLVWGGPSQTGDVSPVGMALSCEHSANRLAFIDGNALTFEYSSNAGSTWTDYGYSATNKSAFCTQEYAVPVGRASASTEYTTSSRTRITLTAQNGTTGYVYTRPRKILINVSTSGGMQVLVEVRTGTNYKSSGAWSTLGTYNLSGWSGWNDIPLVISTLGGGTTQTGNYWQLRLTFIMTSIHATYKTSANILSLRLFGSTAWATPTGQLSRTGHIYSFDMSQNATFPANVTATKFIGALQGNADTATNASKVNNHTVAKDVPSGAVFTDTNTIAGMADVQLTSPTDNDLLVYDSNLSGGKTWKNAKKIVTCTKSQFDAWSANNSFPYTDCKYIVTDAPNTNGTSEDLSYDGGVTSTHDMIEAVRDLIYPVGSIYLSVTDSTVAMVEARFGGTWERLSEGKALFGYSTTDPDFQTIGSGGGNKTVNLQHSHTVDSHSHTIDNQSGYTGSVTLTANQSGVQAHGHGFTQPTVNKGKVSGGITGGGHKHTAGLSSTPYRKAYQQFGACAVAAGSSYTVPCRDGDRAWSGETSSDGHTHDLPDHSHSVSGGKVSDHTGAAAKEGHKHSSPKSTGTNNPATNNQLSTTQNILNPYITVYMYKRTA